VLLVRHDVTSVSGSGYDLSIVASLDAMRLAITSRNQLGQVLPDGPTQRQPA
jgi:hypothetical protein